MFLFRIYVIQLRKKEIVVLAVGRVSSGYFPVWNVYRTVRKKDFMFLARVRVSSQYFPDLDCIPYSCARKRSWISLWLGLAVDIFQFGMYIVQYARRTPCFSLELVLAVSIFQFGMCIVQYARRTSCFSLESELAVSIFQFWIVYRTVRKKDFVFLARVRVSSQYFPDLDCISYSCARKRSWLSLWLGLAVDIFQFGMYIVQYARRASCFC